MVLADKLLHFTDLSLENFLSLTDEVTLQRITEINPEGDRELKLAKKLAIDYQQRNLLKCVFEKTVQRRDRFLTSIFNQSRFRETLASQIASKAKVDQSEVFVDVPTAPSVPISSSRKLFTGVTVVTASGKQNLNNQNTHYELGLDQLPLIGTIAGFMDVLRVYTTAERRSKVKKAAESIFESESFESKVSM